MIFPIGDENPTRSVPVVTWLLIAANAAVFILFNLNMTNSGLEEWTRRWGFDVDYPFTVQIFTSMFMHGGLVHILANMWVLWLVGNNVEDKLGKVAYLVLYVLGGVAAALVFTGIARLSDTEDHLPLVGASGAIAAIMGTYVVFFPEARFKLLVWFFIFVQIVRVRAKWFIGLTLALDLVMSASAHGASVAGVATMAHVGGGVFGILSAFLLKPLVGGGAEGDVWDVHTGFAKRERAGAPRPGDRPGPTIERIAHAAVDESALVNVEQTITRFVRSGHVREAIDVYPAYVAMAREQPLPDDVQIEIAHELYRQWLPKEAIPAYLRYLETHPDGHDVAEAKFRLGVMFAREFARREEAVRWLTQAQREHPDEKIREAAAQLLAQLG